MSLDRQDRIDRYIRGEMPEGEMQAFERDLEKDDFLSRQYDAFNRGVYPKCRGGSRVDGSVPDDK